MINIIEKHTNHIISNPTYHITCGKCGTIFTCNHTDFHKTTDPYDAHFWTWAIDCPVCNNECIGGWEGSIRQTLPD